MLLFSQRLVSLREQNGLSQSDLAILLECSRSAIGMYETNQREPDIKTLWEIADWFNITIDQLVGRFPLNNKQLDINVEV